MAKIDGRRIDVDDIVGKTFGAYKVNRYVGVKRAKPSGSQRYGNVLHMYEVQCTVCGEVRISSRSTIVSGSKNRTMCQLCNMRRVREYVDKERLYTVTRKESLETWRKRKEAGKNNLSTGIKRYSIGYCKLHKKFVHRIGVNVDGRRYRLVNKYSNISEPLPEFISIANELNDVMAEGKENFIQWYENIYKNIK